MDDTSTTTANSTMEAPSGLRRRWLCTLFYSSSVRSRGRCHGPLRRCGLRRQHLHRGPRHLHHGMSSWRRDWRAVRVQGCRRGGGVHHLPHAATRRGDGLSAASVRAPVPRGLHRPMATSAGHVPTVLHRRHRPRRTPAAAGWASCLTYNVRAHWCWSSAMRTIAVNLPYIVYSVYHECFWENRGWLCATVILDCYNIALGFPIFLRGY